MAKVSAYIIAYNEEDKIEAALASVAWADEVLLADSYSTDRTAEIAGQRGARVVQIPFEGFGKLRNTVLSHCTHEWIFSLDSDERCTAEARDEILRTITTPDAADAYLVPRRNLFMGRWIRFSGWYPNYRQPQLFRRGRMRYTEEAVHEGYVLDGRLGKLEHAIWQMPFRTLSQVIDKMNRYSTLGAGKRLEKGMGASMWRALLRGGWAFVRMYILRLGFLDGWAGFVIALSNFEGTFYRYAKLTELARGWPDAAPPVAELRRPEVKR